MRTFEEIIPRGLIVSCQAPAGEPLHGSLFMARLAVAAEAGGAVGIRANGPADVQMICASVGLPVIGIHKVAHPDCPVYITPTFAEAEGVVRAGAQVVALDATERRRPGGALVEDLIAKIHVELRVPVMADVATYEEGIRAVHFGADALASTLSGYVEGSSPMAGPDLELVRRLAAEVSVPVVAEGRYQTPQQAAEAIDVGAYAVVVGTAITRPHLITKTFAEAVVARLSDSRLEAGP